LKKEIAGVPHPISVVVDLAPRKKVVISVRSVAAQKVALGKYAYTFVYSFLTLSHFTWITGFHDYGT
jgi:hypothetical protein